MQLLSELIVLDRKSKTPVYLQLANALVHHIRQGHLRKGLKLPGSREMVALFGIQRNTVLAAFEELIAQGWLETFPKKGTFVSRNLPEVKAVALRRGRGETQERYPEKARFGFQPFDLFQPYMGVSKEGFRLVIDDGFPDVRLAPLDELYRELRSIAHLPAYRKYFNYGSAMGSGLLRETLTAFLSDTRGIPVGMDNLLITRGAQMAVYLAAELLLGVGDHVVVGEPGYLAASRTFLHKQAIVNSIPVDDEGMDIDELERLCRKKTIRLVYVIPHHHSPTTVTLSPERRMRLLELAERYRFAIIEDDYDYDFHYSSKPVLPLASLDRFGNVIYIGTLAKTLAPAIRLGFMVGPADLIRCAATLRRSIDWQGDTAMEIAIANLYKDGTIGRHIRKSVAIYRQRRDHFCEVLARKLGSHVQFNIPGGGMSVWAKFVGVDLRVLAARAAKRGLLVSDGSLFDTQVRYNSCRLGFASLDVKEQDEAIGLLAQCVKPS